MFVAATAFDDLSKVISSPHDAFAGRPSMYPIYMIPAIHLYHLFLFRCTTADWVHHIVFAGIICPMGLFLEGGPISNAIAFFICGLPGGLDYVMLAFVKHGWMSRLREKVCRGMIVTSFTTDRRSSSHRSFARMNRSTTRGSMFGSGRRASPSVPARYTSRRSLRMTTTYHHSWYVVCASHRHAHRSRPHDLFARALVYYRSPR